MVGNTQKIADMENNMHIFRLARMQVLWNYMYVCMVVCTQGSQYAYVWIYVCRKGMCIEVHTIGNNKIVLILSTFLDAEESHVGRWSGS